MERAIFDPIRIVFSCLSVRPHHSSTRGLGLFQEEQRFSGHIRFLSLAEMAMARVLSHLPLGILLFPPARYVTTISCDYTEAWASSDSTTIL